MRDRLGNELSIGERVAYVVSLYGSKRPVLRVGRVESIVTDVRGTCTKVRLEPGQMAEAYRLRTVRNEKRIVRVRD